MLEETIQDEELPRIFKVRKTLMKLIEDRGFKVDDMLKTKSFDDWKNEFKLSGFKLEFYVSKGDSKKDEETLYIKYFSKPKIGVEEIGNFTQEVGNRKFSCGIMVIRGNVTALAKQKIKEYSESIHVQLFQEKELVVNVTEHELVPKHILLSKEEKEALLKRYKLKESQLPKILITDPVAKYLGLQRSDVVKIIRASETAGRYITYRIAI